MNQLSEAIVIIPADNGDPAGCTYQFDSLIEGVPVVVESGLTHQPKGLRSMAIPATIKYSDVLDFTVVMLDQPGTAAGVFTRNRSASPAVKLGRQLLQDGQAQALVVLSKNANLFAPHAQRDTEEIVSRVAEHLGIDKNNVLISCTGVIGVPLPMSNVRAAIDSIQAELQTGIIDSVAEAIMTTDVGPKTASIRYGDVVIAGMAKGAGMIEPNMATMLAYYYTNLAIPAEQLQSILKRVTDSTYNSISVDTDTSTSDSVIVFSTNEIEVTEDKLKDFENALAALSLKLCRDMVYQAEGANTLVEVTVSKARSEQHAKSIAKQIVNSPLVKTAVFGADPNWGRIVMALGKTNEDDDYINAEKLVISIAGMPLFDKGQVVDHDLEKLSATMKQLKTLDIAVELGEGNSQWTVWGCDLSYRYVEINAEYTT